MSGYGPRERGGAALPPEQETFVALMRLQDRLLHEVAEVVRGEGLSVSQYNVLRILRGAGPGGLPCRAIAGRMIQRLPDVTRLLDRLEGAGLVERTRSSEDRRVVLTRLLPEGAARLERLDGPVLELHRRQFAALGGPDLARLGELLGRLQDAPALYPETPE